MGNIVHIIIVGTSLLSNTGEIRNCTSLENEIKNLNNKCKNTKDSLSNGLNERVLYSKISEINVLLLKLNPEDEIKFRPAKDGGPKDRLPQEVSYLTIKAKEKPPETGNNKGQARCYLISSDSKIGKVCAGVIKEYVNQQVFLKMHYEVKDVEVADGVDAESAGKFKNAGFRNLINKINEIIDKELKGAARIYLNITGGFKGMVPYGTIVGMLRASEKITLCYLFEDSKEIIEMPRYPIGIDFHLWHRNAARLQIVMEGHDVNNAFYNKLNEPVKNLLFNEGSKNSLFSLGKTLKKQYDDLLQIDPLKVYSSEIVDNLMKGTDETTARLKDILKKIIDSVGDLIWVGDKIPEMVEHAHRHHHNLLVFAEMFLTPVLAVNPEFLTPEETFCLLAGVLLHDCGHSLNYITVKKEDGSDLRVPLFTSEIRDFHHYLSCQRLNNKETAEELNWPYPDNEAPPLDKKLHEAVLIVCLYHRKRMSYTADGQFTIPFINKTFPSLQKHITDLKDKLPAREKVDLMKVVALMRLIDSWDNQSRRAGSKKYVEHVLGLMKRDEEIAWEKAKIGRRLLYTAYKATTKDSNIKEICALIVRKPKEWYTTGHVLCHALLNKPSCTQEEKTFARAWLVAAESIDNANMKSHQEKHYMKHQHIKEVLIVPDNTDNKFGTDNINFKIIFVENSASAKDLDASNKYPGLEGRTMRAFVESEEVLPEYEPLKKYIKTNYKITLTYCWRNNEGGEQIFGALQ